MAASSVQDDDLVTGINVTPLVDVTLVLLVVLMITASYVASKAIPMDLPKSATGESVSATVSVSIDAAGRTYLDANPIDAHALQERIRALRGRTPELQVVIAADGHTPHEHVVRVIDLLRQEQVTSFAINVSPQDLAR